MLTELFIESRGGPPPARLVLDIDCTDDEMHGRQEGRFFHGYYGHYCFLPLYVFCGAHPLCAVLRPGNADPALGVVRQLRRIVGQFRRRWPDVELIVRADSAYAREESMAFREGERDIHYVLGVARNDRLAGRIAPELLAAKVESKGRGRPVRLYTEFAHSTRTSWSRARRLIAKAEHIPGKPNPRFLVTSLPETISPRTVYERIYCPRGNAENAIEEQQLDIFADRTSATPIAANQLRLLFSAFASVLMIRLRAALAHTRLARATAGSLRLKLLRIGARVSGSVRRVAVAMDSTTPSRPSSPAPAHGSPRSTPPHPRAPYPTPAPGPWHRCLPAPWIRLHSAPDPLGKGRPDILRLSPHANHGPYPANYARIAFGGPPPGSV